MTEKMILYRFGQEDGKSSFNPRMKPWVTIGETRTMKGQITPCLRGFHGSPSLWDALQYGKGPIAEMVELSGDLQPHGTPVDKWVGRKRTLLARVDVSRELRLFAADCAEHVLPLFETKYPNDDRPRLAIRAARILAEGDANAAAAAKDANAASAAAAASYVAASAASYASFNAAANAAAAGSYVGYAAANAAAAASSTAAANAAAAADWPRQAFTVRFANILSEARP